jgi:hypothetical protein
MSMDTDPSEYAGPGRAVGRLLATSGAPHTLIGTVAGRTRTTFIEGDATDADVTFLTIYHYVVQATRNLWRSVDSTQASHPTADPDLHLRTTVHRSVQECRQACVRTCVRLQSPGDSRHLDL